MIPFSILDLATVTEGSDPGQALRNSLDLAQHAEKWGYHRFWLAEHHNMVGIASAATSVVIGYIAGGTSTIRVGSGGVMLPNHAPLIVAEQFGTLATLYPDRIDLGIGRAPGTDPVTAWALRRYASSVDNFPNDVEELRDYFREPVPGQAVRAVPGAGLRVPIWILGSSLFGARLAARLGLPYAFASHFAPDHLLDALAVYREEFKPSEDLEKPYAMAAINAFVADTDREAKLLFTSPLEQFARLRGGDPGKLQPPNEAILEQPEAYQGPLHALRYSAVGSPDTVRDEIRRFLEMTQVDELMVTAQIYDHAARLRSFELLAEVRASLT